MKRSLTTLFLALLVTPVLRADEFDRYTNAVLRTLPAAKAATELKKLPLRTIVETARVLPDDSGALLVVRTNEDRFSKLVVHAGRQRIDKDRSLPVLLVDRFVTYREGTEQTILASGKNIGLYPGFRLNLDLGQIVPEELRGDLHLVGGDKPSLETLGEARLYLITEALPQLAEVKTEKPAPGKAFEARYFNGSYKLHDDGRRSGTLKLQVGDDGGVTGTYTSDKDGQNYEVQGKVGAVRSAIQFTVRFPRAEQDFQGWMFTGDGSAIAGSSRMLDHEAGFYATRIEGK